MGLSSIANFFKGQAGRVVESQAQGLIQRAQSRFGSLTPNTMKYKGRTALAKTVGFVGRNQGYTGMALGGAAGYMTGGFEGAMLGAAVGGIGGKHGKWGSYRETGNLGAFQTKIGSKISKYAPGLAGRYGRRNITGAPKISGMKIDLSNMRTMSGTEVGGRALGGIAGGLAAMAGAGAFAGVGATLAATPFRAAGTSFGSTVSTTFGNSFSGMGNGTVTGY